MHPVWDSTLVVSLSYNFCFQFLDRSFLICAFRCPLLFACLDVSSFFIFGATLVPHSFLSGCVLLLVFYRLGITWHSMLIYRISSRVFFPPAAANVAYSTSDRHLFLFYVFPPLFLSPYDAAFFCPVVSLFCSLSFRHLRISFDSRLSQDFWSFFV